jgi:hypothetical protein
MENNNILCDCYCRSIWSLPDYPEAVLADDDMIAVYHNGVTYKVALSKLKESALLRLASKLDFDGEYVVVKRNGVIELKRSEHGGTKESR